MPYVDIPCKVYLRCLSRSQRRQMAIGALTGSTQRLSKSSGKRQCEPVAQASRSLGKIAATMPCAATGVTAPEVRSTTLGVPSEL